MKTQTLGNSGIEVSRLAYGCMRLSGSWDRRRVDAEAIARGICTLEVAVEAGYTFFDHADIYGDTTCESIFGQALRKHPAWRDRLVMATKCGIRLVNQPERGQPYRYDSSADHIIRSAEDSLRRLQVEKLDLLMLHRPDFLADPGEVAQAFSKLRSAGKVREFGVSNFRPSLVSALQRALDFPLEVHQIEMHPLRLEPLTDGTLDQSLELGLTPMAWSPLAGGKLASGAVPDSQSPDDSRHLAILKVLDEIAKELGTSRTVIALSWLLRHPSKIVPVIGTTNHDRIREAVSATEIKLDRPTWYRILRAAQGHDLA